MSKVDAVKLKEIIKILNAATYVDENDAEMSFLETNIKTVGVSTDALFKAFSDAIEGLPDEVSPELPDDVIDFYNATISGAEAEPEPEAPKAKAKPEAPKVKAKAEAPKAKAKAEEPKKDKPKASKEKAELSIFGHKKVSQAGTLDALLAPGKSISLEDLSKQSGRSILGVKSHIKHLMESRNLTINVKDNMYRYVKNPAAK